MLKQRGYSDKAVEAILASGGVMILDRDLKSVVQVYFKPDRVICEHCGSGCRHIEFALSIPKVQEILREKGWKPST